jgi:hypothetical protein
MSKILRGGKLSAWFALFAALTLSLGCGSKSSQPAVDPTPAPSPAPQAGPWVKADPNPASRGSEKFGTTTISWNTGSSETGQVFVSVNGAPETMFADRPEGSLEATWIGAGVYEFRLYAGKEHVKLLASVKVLGSE